MKIKFNETDNKFTIDMTGEGILTQGQFNRKDDPSMTECDCTPKIDIVGATYINVTQITAWNLLFDGDLRNKLKQIKNG